MSVSPNITLGPAANIADERPGSCNCNVLGLKYPLELARQLTAGPNFRRECPAVISARASSAQILEREWLLLGVPTWVTDVSPGWWAPEASINRCSPDILSCSGSVDAEARS